MDSFWIITTGILAASCCSLIGCFLLLKKMSMLSDAISHAVLPGIVIAFLFTHDRNPFPMLLGAGLVGIFTTFLIHFLIHKARLAAGASIGVTYTWLFALGVILITLLADKVDLDQDCVLFGEILFVPFDMMRLGVWEVPRSWFMLLPLLCLITGFIMIFNKELTISIFDPVFASCIGVSVAVFHYLLLGITSITAVASFELVGAVLVIAFFIVPPATAYLISKSIRSMLLVCLLLNCIIAFVGYYSAAWLNVSISGAMTCVAGILFLLVFIKSKLYY